MESFVSVIFFKKIKIGFSILVWRFKIFEKEPFCTKNDQNCQKCKLDEFFMSILKGLKWFLEKKFGDENCFLQLVLPIFNIFFWFMIIQKAQNWKWKIKKIPFFKNSFNKCTMIVENFQQMLKIILSTIFWDLNSL